MAEKTPAPPTLNPYKLGAFYILSRLKWDLDTRFAPSRARLHKLRNQYAGKKAVVVCNGPSLLKTDFSLLKDTYCFGLNKINLLFDKSDFRPSSIVSINSFVIEQNTAFYNETNIPLFLDRYAARYVRRRPNVTFLHTCESPRVAGDCGMSISAPPTVTVAALQLAFHMGFKEVALIGCDHNFATRGEANKTVVSGQTDPNHFDPNYFAGGVKWQLPDLVSSEYYYFKSRELFEQFGRRVVNCTDGGALEIYERQSLQEFIKG